MNPDEKPNTPPNDQPIAARPENRPFDADAEPATTPPPSPFQLNTQPAKKSKKPLIIGAIAAALLVVLLGGGALAYNMGYQNPDKVVGDGLMNVLKAKSVTGDGEFTATSKDTDLKVTLNNKNDRQQGSVAASLNLKLKDQDTSIDLKGEGMYAKDGNLYVKVSDVQKAYDSYIDQYVDNISKEYKDADMAMTADEKEELKSSASQFYSKSIEKIDNKWIKISPDDLKDINEDAGDIQACYTKAFEMIDKDKKVSDEIANSYRDNKFIEVKEELGSKDGSLGYKIAINEDASDKFGKSLENTAFGKQLKSCDKSTSSTDSDSTKDESSDSDSLKDTNVELWIDRWSHKITKVNASGTVDNGEPTKLNMVYSPKFNQSVSLETPKDAVSLKQLQDDIESILGSTSESTASTAL